MNIKISFVSNFINHHQLPFCEEMYKRLGGNFTFIQVQPMDEGRVSMGWHSETEGITYLHKAYEEEEVCTGLIRESDILILGWTGLKKGAALLEVIEERMNSKKPVIRISERIYREGRYKAVSPRGLLSKYNEHIRFRKSPVFLLCAGAYVSGDFNLIGAYPQKMFKWGYFPPLKTYDDGALEKMFYREGEKLNLCFAGRLVKLKHPEFALYAARYLKSAGFDFTFHIVGDGPLLGELKKTANDEGLNENIIFYGAKSPDKVREIMEMCHVAIFCSNYLEGWGAVVNEAMNSACAVIASREAGAVPFLIEDRINGMTYDRCDREEFINCLGELMKSPGAIRLFQRNAYNTIKDVWNAENACEELLTFCERVLTTGYSKSEVPSDGPMSFAEVIPAPGFLRTLTEDNHLE